ncbi:MAG TPA: glycosyltransferase family 39 protein [Thermoleophilaceae bacterium]
MTALQRVRPFWLLLGVITAIGCVARVAYILLVARHITVQGDALTFHLLANLLAQGHGFVAAQPYALQGIVEPTAEHPPLYPLILAGVSWIGETSYTAHRLASALMGTGTVFAIGVLGRRVAGERVGLVGAAVAALYPILIVTDGTLLSESLYGLLIALTLIAAYRLLDKPSLWRAAALGGLCALCALTRAEASLLLLLLVIPLAWRGGRALRGRRIAVGVVAFFLVLAPWLIRTWIAFNQPVWISTNSGTLIGGANCRQTYYGDQIGLWRIDCLKLAHGTEAHKAAIWRRQGIDFARDHAGRVPIVAAVRVLRVWDFYRPNQGANYETLEQRDLRTEQIGLGVYYALLPLALYGAVLLRRNRWSLYILLTAPILVTISAAIGYGITRLRMAAEVSLVVLAAVAVVALLERLAAQIPSASGTLEAEA